MPNGYNYKLVEDTQTLEEFILGCAKAFGSCAHQRDEPADMPPRCRGVEPKPKDYNPLQALELELEKTLLKLEDAKQMHLNVAKKLSDASYDKMMKEATDMVFDRSVLEDRMEFILQKAIEWMPPTDDHDALKEFAIAQIENVMKHDCDSSYYQRILDNIHRQTGLEYRNEQITFAEQDIEYVKEKIERKKKEAETFNGDKWILDLYKSLGIKYPYK
jgi:uncharacterized membrane-anchored protein YjiN (DUF445 family)